MKANLVKTVWGFMLIVLGGLFLADTLGYMEMDLLTRQGWAIFCASLSVAFFLSYFLLGVKQWGWLFPALIFAALSLVIGGLVDRYEGDLIALSILLSVTIPFYVGYLVDRKQWGLLIPAWVMTVVSSIAFFADTTASDWVGALVLYGIALPFFVVYLANHQRKWALIVGSALAFIGVFPLIGPILPDEYAGPVIMSLFALFFLAIYFAIKKAWWAIIPAGTFFSIGLVALLDTLLPDHTYFMIGGLEFGGYTGVLLLGFAATFGILWLLRGSQPTAWAKYPAIGLLVFSFLSFLMWKTASNLLLAVELVAIGAGIIVSSVLKRRDTKEITPSQT